MSSPVPCHILTNHQRQRQGFNSVFLALRIASSAAEKGLYVEKLFLHRLKAKAQEMEVRLPH